MRKLLIILIILFSKCYSQPVIDKQIKPYVDEFLKESDHWRIPLTNYYDLKHIYYCRRIPGSHWNDSVIGLYLPEKQVIYIKKIKRGNPKFIRLVVWHELGHMIFNLDHITGRLAIMNPTLKYYKIDEYYDCWYFLLQDFYIEAQKLENYRMYKTHDIQDVHMEFRKN